mgnify:CR=1 FL=1
MGKNGAVVFRIFPQFLLKTVFFMTAVTACLNLFRLRAFSGSVSFLPSAAVLAEAASFSAVLSAIQFLFLSERVIRKMPFRLRRVLTAVGSLPAAILLGLRFGWFRPAPALLTVLTPVLLLSLFLGTGFLLWVQKNDYHGFWEIFRAALRGCAKVLTAVLAAVVIGLCAGYRGHSELERPWQNPEISVSEICRTKEDRLDI